MYNDKDKKPCPDIARRGANGLQSIGFVLLAGMAMGTIALLMFLWGVKHGAFEDAEDAKYIVFRDEEDEED